jgi:hypothetical protein
MKKVKMVSLIVLAGIILLLVYAMFFSKKEFKSISQYSDTWGVAQASLENKPVFVRYREGLQDAIGHPDFPFQIGVAVPLLKPTADGLTVNSEAEELYAIEDELERVLGENDEIVFALTITFNGMREFVFYASEWKPEYFEQKIKQIGASIRSGHELQFMMQKDEKWETFKTYTRT